MNIKTDCNESASMRTNHPTSTKTVLQQTLTNITKVRLQIRLMYPVCSCAQIVMIFALN